MFVRHFDSVVKSTIGKQPNKTKQEEMGFLTSKQDLNNVQ